MAKLLKVHIQALEPLAPPYHVHQRDVAMEILHLVSYDLRMEFYDTNRWLHMGGNDNSCLCSNMVSGGRREFPPWQAASGVHSGSRVMAVWPRGGHGQALLCIWNSMLVETQDCKMQMKAPENSYQTRVKYDLTNSQEKCSLSQIISMTNNISLYCSWNLWTL